MSLFSVFSGCVHGFRPGLIPLAASLIMLAVPAVSSGAEAPLAPVAEQKRASSEQDLPVTLKASIAGLLRSHDRIKAADSAAVAAGHMLERSKGAWYPRLNASGEGGKEDVDFPGTTKSTSKLRNAQSLSATQTLFDFGATSGGVNQAEGVHNEAVVMLGITRQEVSLQGVTSFLGLIRTREMLRYAVRSEENIKRLSGMQEALVERGVGLSYEELQIKAQLSNSQAHRVNVERAYAIARNNFKSVFGVALSDSQIDALVLPSLPKKSMPANLDEAIAKALESSPALLALEQTLATKQGDLEVRRSAMFPRLEAVADVTRKENDQGESGVRSESRAGLQASYNVFSGFRDVENVNAAKSDMTSVRMSILDRRRVVEERVRNVWNDLQTLLKTISLYESQANLTWSYLELVKKKKDMGGDVTITEIITGERDYITATSNKVASEIEHITAAYTLLNQMGLITPDVVEN
ncbi:MAG: TolC family protein [Proteobacteria bacterium]|nr:TolC family protein [Pseudomonadota bacterium]MBU1595250.1 TolC family protein [Pseudomonadota bacterium]